MFKSISNIFLICKNLEKSRKFYSDILQLKEKKKESDFIEYEIGGNCLVIHAPIKDKIMKEWNLSPVIKERGSGVILTCFRDIQEILIETFKNVKFSKNS